MTKQHIFITVPGGKDGQGGIVRQMHYLREAAAEYAPQLPLVFLQTRSTHGPWFGCFIRAWFGLLAALLRRQVALLHLNVSSNASFYRKYALFLLAKLFGRPVITHLHSGFFDRFYARTNPLSQWMIRHLFCHSRYVLILGEYWRDFMEQTLDVSPEHIVVHPNAVKGPASWQLKTPGNPIRLLFLGQLIPAKGIDDLLEALADAPLCDMPWQLTMAGGGQLAHYRERVHALGLASKIAIPGWQSPEQVEALCAASDILILPSHVENQPLVILEAMAFGLGIITTRVGTVAEIITHGEQGLLYDAQDIPALRAHISQLIEDTEQLSALQAAARARYTERFQPQNYVQTMARLYAY